MALKANVTYGAKRSKDYNSDNFCVTLESEISDIQHAQAEIAALFQEAKRAVATEMAQAERPRQAQSSPAENRTAPPRLRQSSSVSTRRASSAQVKAIFAISKQLGMARGEFESLLQEEYRAHRPEELSVSEASKLIERLKSFQAA